MHKSNIALLFNIGIFGLLVAILVMPTSVAETGTKEMVPQGDTGTWKLEFPFFDIKTGSKISVQIERIEGSGTFTLKYGTFVSIRDDLSEGVVSITNLALINNDIVVGGESGYDTDFGISVTVSAPITIQYEVNQKLPIDIWMILAIVAMAAAVTFLILWRKGKK